MKEIIKRGLFVVIKSKNKNKWILLKDGSRTPVFLDTSKFISYPELFAKTIRFIVQEIKGKKIEFDRIVGLPYGGLPFTYGVADTLKVPCLAVRKEGKKNYSTAGDLLGIFKKNERILLIEDAICTANTAIGFVKRLRQEKLIVKDIITIVDTEASGRENLEKENIRLHALFTWSELRDAFNRQRRA